MGILSEADYRRRHEVFVDTIQTAFVYLDPYHHRAITVTPIRYRRDEDGREYLVCAGHHVDITNFTSWAIARELNSMIREVCA